MREVKASLSPAGDQIGPVAPPFRLVSWTAFAPLASATQSWSPATYATRRPSGDQLASEALMPAAGNGTGVPPAAGMRYVVPER